jgi:hypothetical protein
MVSARFLQQYCESALEILNSQYRATQVMKHNATAGAAREQIIKDFLTAHLPQLVSILSGQIVDSRNSYSKQQDVVLVMKSMPRLPFASGSDLIFQEGVIATAEIKTVLDTKALTGIAANIQSVKSLVPSIGSSAVLASNHLWPGDRILTSIVTYGGMDLTTVEQSLSVMDAEVRPDIVLDLGQGILIRNHGLLLPRQMAGEYVLCRNPAEGFKCFLTFLIEIAGTLSARGVQWRSYW